MSQNLSTLARKTKAEVLIEYEKLLASIEVAKGVSREVHEPTNIQTIISARNDFSVKGVEEAVSELKTSIAGKLSEVSKKVSETLDALMKQTLEGVEKFSGLTNAIDLSEKRLKSNYNIEIAATTLETLVAEYADAKKQLELERTTLHAELTESIALKKRDRERDEEEYVYTLKTSRAREQAQHEDSRKKKEEELRLREEAVREAEIELQTLRTKVQNIPAEHEKLVHAHEQDVIKRLTTEHVAHTERLEKAWESEKNIFGLKYAHLESQYKKLEAEMLSAKKEADLAQKKAQELAVTVIEHSGGRLSPRGDAREAEEKK